MRASVTEIILLVLLILATVFFVVEKNKTIILTTRLNNDSIISQRVKDSIEVEFKKAQQRIDKYAKLDSLRKNEYERLLNRNSTLSRDSLRKLFTGS